MLTVIFNQQLKASTADLGYAASQSIAVVFSF